MPGLSKGLKGLYSYLDSLHFASPPSGIFAYVLSLESAPFSSRADRSAAMSEVHNVCDNGFYFN